MRAGKQYGFTLIEMLVALLIASIFFSVFIGVVLATFETLRTGDERTTAQQNARVAINYIANDIRHATDIAPLRFEAYRDWATGGFPVNEDVIDPFFGGATKAWPIYRESIDGDPRGYIDLDIKNGTGEGDEYISFRDDGLPYDVRALSPNKINLTFFGSSYFPETDYWHGAWNQIDLDLKGGGWVSNPTAGSVRVTYEHQLVAPLHRELYDPNFSGREKSFDMVVSRQDANSIADKQEFVVVRSFSMRNPTQATPDVGETGIQPNNGANYLGNVSPQIRIDQPLLRQPVADHVIGMRFRYWHISGNVMLEIRYDPNTADMGGNVTTNDGYYRYFNQYGREIYVYYNPTATQMVPLLKTDYTEADWDSVPGGSFYIDGGDDGTDEYQRGLLLFEGWKYVNAISITVKTANNQTLNIYKSSINQNVTVPGAPGYDLNNPDYGMGFVDFGLQDTFTDAAGTLNAYEPLYQGADNVRQSSITFGTYNLFDFVEPNMNPNYDASAFTTLQTFVVPPALGQRADQATEQLRFRLDHIG